MPLLDIFVAHEADRKAGMAMPDQLETPVQVLVRRQSAGKSLRHCIPGTAITETVAESLMPSDAIHKVDD